MTTTTSTDQAGTLTGAGAGDAGGANTDTGVGALVESMPAGARLAAVLDSVDFSTLSNDELTQVLLAQDRQVSHETGRKVELIAQIGRRLEVSEKECHDWPWEMGEFEIQLGLVLTATSASRWCTLAYFAWVTAPAVGRALTAGLLDEARARVFQLWTDPLSQEHTRAVVEKLLPEAMQLTTAQLCKRIAEMAIALDPAWVKRRYERAVRRRRVVGYSNSEGTANVSGYDLPTDQAASACERLDRLARAAKSDGHPDPIDSLRADLFLALLNGDYNGLTDQQIVNQLLTNANVNAATTGAAAAPDTKAADTQAPDTQAADTEAGETEAGNSQTRSSQADAAGANARHGDDHPADDTSANPSRNQDHTQPPPANNSHADNPTSNQPAAPSQNAAPDQNSDSDQHPEPSKHPAPSNDPEPEQEAAANQDSPRQNPEPGPDPEPGRDSEPAPDASTTAGAAGAAGGAAAAGSAGRGAASGESTGDGVNASNSTRDTGARAGGNGGNGADDDTDGSGGLGSPSGGGSGPGGPGGSGPGSAGSGDGGAGSSRRFGPSAGLRVMMRLVTLIGLDRRPGRLLGWGPLHAELARSMATTPHATWSYVLVDDDGIPLISDTIRRRPTNPDTPPAAAGPAAGAGHTAGTGHAAGSAHSAPVRVWIQFTQAVLDSLMRQPPPGWAAVLTEINTSIQKAAEAKEKAAEKAKGKAQGREPRFPDAELRRWIQLRDQTCTFGGCGAPGHRCDIDHTVPHAQGGVTQEQNLCCVCRRHHRLRHEGGWNVEQPTPGRVIWTSLLGQRRSRRPPSNLDDLPEPMPIPTEPEPDSTEADDRTHSCWNPYTPPPPPEQPPPPPPRYDDVEPPF